MKKLIVIIVLAVVAFSLFRNFASEVKKVVSTDAGLAQAIEAENKKLPRDLPSGARLEKMRTEPGLRVLGTATLPMYARDLNIKSYPDASEFACTDKVGRWLLDSGVTFVIQIEDKGGLPVLKQEVRRADCK